METDAGNVYFVELDSQSVSCVTRGLRPRAGSTATRIAPLPFPESSLVEDISEDPEVLEGDETSQSTS